jgi:hypothetical protein
MLLIISLYQMLSLTFISNPLYFQRVKKVN